MALSLLPEDAVASGGFLDDEDATLKTVRAVMFDYAGTRVNDPSPAIRAVFDRGDGEEWIEHYTCGKSKDQIPSADGKSFDNLRADQGTRNGLPETCKGLMFLTSILNAGFPKDKVSNDLSVFDDMDVHINRIPDLERKGLNVKKENSTVAVITKIHK